MQHVFRGTFGATVLDNGTRFTLWAPAASRVLLSTRDGAGERELELTRDEQGFFRGVDPAAAAGTRYAFLIDGDPLRIPDPASRYQPEGVHGDSAVHDPGRYDWPQNPFAGRPWHEHVLYELHLGTFSPEGTYAGAIARLDHLVRLGVTAVELMPLSQSPGARNWGYDGVYHYAPNHTYGTPEDLKGFVVAAHDRGLGVFLDVVYNHFGPEGNFLHRYAPEFFTERHATPWGTAIDYSSPGNDPVRAFFVENALYWLSEYQFDGLRFDATQCIYDEREPQVLHELAEHVRADIPRPVHLVVENDLNELALLQPGGYEAQWNDDVHHAAHVLVTGQRDGYYSDYAQRPAWWLARALTSGYGYQGDPSPLRDGLIRGAPSEALPLARFVNFLQNHDQIGNRPFGERIGRLAEPAALRAAVATVLLAPSPPLLFMGEEWNASAPFLFFCDFEPELAQAVRNGRAREFATFADFAGAGHEIPDATAPATFERCRLNWNELTAPDHAAWLAYYRDVLAVRAREIVPYTAGLHGRAGAFTMHGAHAFTARWTLAQGATLELQANLGPVAQAGVPEPDAARLVFAAHQDGGGPNLGPWSVRWFRG